MGSCYKEQNAQLVLCGDLEEWDGMVGGIPQEGGNIYILTADSLHCTTETNTTL